MNRIVEVLIERDNMSRVEAKKLFKDARKAFMDMVESGEMDTYLMDEFCHEWFGLEPDYIDDIIYLAE